MIENPGPLAEMPNQPAKNFYGGRYNMEVLQEDRIMYRAGNAQNPYGRWFTSEPSSYIDNVYAIKIPRVLLFIQDQSDRKVEYMWEDVMLCKPI